MTSARTVRLSTILILTSGLIAGGSILDAQSSWDQAPRYQDRYDPTQYIPDSSDRPPYDAQDSWWDIAAYVSIVDGSADLLRAGERVRDFEQVSLEVGDTLRTTRGRVELLFDDGSIVSLDEYSSLTIDDRQSWRLQEGRMKLTWRGDELAIDASPTGRVLLRSTGDYRVTLASNRQGQPEVELAVTRGSAELENALGRTLVRPGTRALTTVAYAPSIPYAFSTPNDTFERWTMANESDRYGVESVRYLPTDLRAYGGAFDRYGYWSNHSSYGWVWYPRVSAGWQPYYGGRWTFIVNFGYSWVGGARWEWPAYHYGRWDRRGAQWFWIPSRNIQTHRVGYAVPRRSVTTSVSYYTRPMTSRPAPSRATNGRGAVQNNGRPSNTQTPRAVTRTGSRPQTSSTPSRVQTRPSATPTQRQSSQPQATRRAPSTSQPTSSPAPSTSRSAPPVTRQAPSQNRSSSSRTARPSQPQRSTPSTSRSPSRSTPAARSAPSSGSRSTPSTSRAPSRSTPAARTAPSSGSRTPSAGSRSSSSQGRTSSGSGTATRRTGRGGGGGR